MDLRQEFLTTKKDVTRLKAEGKAVEVTHRQATQEIERELSSRIDIVDGEIQRAQVK